MEEEFFQLDISSTSRNRNEYPNPYDFLIPYQFANKGSTALDYFDPVLSTTPFTGSIKKKPGDLVIGISFDQSQIKLDDDDIDIDNFYVNRTLQIDAEFCNIIAYDGTTKIATLETPFNVIPPAGKKYYIRNTRNYYNSNIALVDVNTANNTVSKFSLLTVDPSVLTNFFAGSFVRFTNGPHTNQTAALVLKYEPSGQIFAWQQDNSPGKNTYIPVDSEIGFKFIPSFSGQVSDIIMRVSAFESDDSQRTIRMKILSGDGLSSTIIHQEDFTIINNFLPTDKRFLITSGPMIFNPAIYTVSITDITNSGRNTGFVSIYGIDSGLNNVAFNTSVYPKMSVNTYPISNTNVWSQNVSDGKDAYLDVNNEFGFSFSLTESGKINQVIISLISYETVSNGRTVKLKIREGQGVTGTVIYQQNYNILDQLTASDYTFNISSSIDINVGQVYTITLLDITLGGISSGFVDIFGIISNSNYVSINTDVYPSMKIFYTPPESSIWLQSSVNNTEELITSLDKGFRFKTSGSGILKSISILLSSYDSLNTGRTLRLKIRYGQGLAGTIIYEQAFIVENLSTPQPKFFDISSGPLLSDSTIYTFILQDITTGGNTSGYCRMHGIQSDSTYTSYNSSIYPQTQLSVILPGNSTTWDQNITSASNNVTTETGYGFTPSVSGILSQIDLKFKTNNVNTTFTLSIREGFGLSGNIIYQQAYTYTLNNFTLTNIPITSGPFLNSGNNYTLTLQSSTLTFLIGGIPSTVTYPVYGLGNYPNIIMTVVNGILVWSQPDSVQNSTIIDNVEKGFQFIAGGNGSYLLTSVDLNMTSFNSGSDKSIIVNVRNGSGLSGTIIYTATVNISDKLNKQLVNIPLNNPPLTSGDIYTISLIDNNSGTNGYSQIYGIVSNISYTSYSTSIYPNMKINGNIMILGFQQISNPSSVGFVDTILEHGFTFIPSSSGKLSAVKFQLSSFESLSSGRNLTIKVRNGTGVSGTVIYTSTFFVTNQLPRFEYNFFLGNTVDVLAGNIYSITVKDTTSGTNTGIIFLYGINPNIDYSSFNISSYPKIDIFLSVSTPSCSQNISLTQTNFISDIDESIFYVTPKLPGTFNELQINLSSYSTLGGRTLNMKLYDGPSTSSPLMFQQNVIIPNIDPPGVNFSIGINSMPVVRQNSVHTLTFIDVTGGSNNGATSIYGIVPTTKYSTNMDVYPRMRWIVPSYIITVNPPQNVDEFFANSLDNIEFNTQAYDNASTIFMNKAPKNLPMCEIKLEEITLPYQLLKVGRGSYVNHYPYIYVKLYNEGEGSVNVFSSNNPNSLTALFKIPCRISGNITTDFVTLYGYEYHDIKLRPDKSLRFVVTLPDGTILQNAKEDNFSPLFPNPFLQISASFSLRYHSEKTEQIRDLEDEKTGQTQTQNLEDEKKK